jgi:hypothetical protein
LKLLVRLSLLVALSSSSFAFAQTCTPPASWRAPLTYFCADTPALASQVNDNFGQVVAWVEAKVGRVGQAFATDGGVIITQALADGAVTTPKLAPLAVDTSRLANGAVDTSKLATGAVTRDKLSGGGVAVYANHSSCADPGVITFNSTCTYFTTLCGVTCGGFGQAYFACDGSCPNTIPACSNVPRPCQANNPIRGYLVAP